MNQTRKGLSLFALTMIAIGATIGSGIFKTPSSIASKVDDNNTILILWIVGGIVSLLGALIFAEFGSRYSNAGGVYTYLNKAFGPLPGFLYGWCLLTVISSGTIAALCTVFAENINYVMGSPLAKENEKFLAMISIVVLTLFNTFGIKSSEWFANIGTVLKIIGIYLLLFAALILGKNTLFGETIHTVVQSSPTQNNLAGAFVGVLWSYTGWHYASFVSGDAINPKRNIPLAMIFGTTVVTLTYLLCNMGYFKVLDHDTIMNSEVVAADAMAAIMPGFGKIIAGLIAISTFACAGLYVLSTPRIFNQMSKDGLFFSVFAKEHPKFQVPVNAIVLQSVWAILLVMLWGKFSSIIEYVTFVEWLFLLVTCVGIFRIRQMAKEKISSMNDPLVLPKTEAAAEPAFKTPFYPVLPIVFIAIIGWFIVKNAVADKIEYYAGLVVIPVGVVFYFINKLVKRSNSPVK
jgi:basic amino acid/polyamine antiporter, APA family